MGEKDTYRYIQGRGQGHMGREAFISSLVVGIVVFEGLCHSPRSYWCWSLWLRGIRSLTVAASGLILLSIYTGKVLTLLHERNPSLFDSVFHRLFGILNSFLVFISGELNSTVKFPSPLFCATCESTVLRILPCCGEEKNASAIVLVLEFTV